MTLEQRTEINQQNAQHSTGPKTDEGKAISSQNALKHGLTASTLPKTHPAFQAKLTLFKDLYPLSSPEAQILIQEVAHLAYKLEQIPQIEYEIELNSPLTLAEHFMQDKPTPLTRLWNLELRIIGRLNTLLKKLTALSRASVPAGHPHSAPISPVQNKPTPKASILQNEPKTPLQSNLKTFQALNQAIQSLTQLNL